MGQKIQVKFELPTTLERVEGDLVVFISEESNTVRPERQASATTPTNSNSPDIGVTGSMHPELAVRHVVGHGPPIVPLLSARDSPLRWVP